MLAGVVVPPIGTGALPLPHTSRPGPVLRRRQRRLAGLVLRSCGVGGAIYDLASVLLGGPTGQALRGEEFKRARAYVRDAFGELT